MADKNIAKKEKAIEIMKKMDIYKPYINGFEQKDKVCFFEQFGGFWIDLYATKKAIEDEEKRKELYAQFAIVAEKYLSLQHSKRSAFICVIARSPADLIREGEALHHCVGRMNYDQRMVREESLIFFVRAKDSPDIPLVTLEYSPRNHKVLQCYGEHDHKPSEDILHYVNKIWLPYANKKINN